MNRAQLENALALFTFPQNMQSKQILKDISKTCILKY